MAADGGSSSAGDGSSRIGLMAAARSAALASRHAWPGQVAYRSQFMTAMDRAYLGMERIKRRLIGDLDPQNWDPAAKAKMDALADVLPACRAV